jgi:hypothetical protein
MADDDAGRAPPREKDDGGDGDTTAANAAAPGHDPPSASATSAPNNKPSPPRHPFTPSTFACPVCLDMMYKPAIASPCAHALCFWCHHRAMNAFAPSACPLCRSRFRHQAGVCGPLHMFLGAAFPAEFAAREAEVVAEEAEHGVASMAVEPPDEGVSDALSERAWACADRACGRLLARPTALLCGHVVCGACVPAASSPACPRCGRVGRAGGEGGDPPPRPCPVLAEVVAGLFPEAYGRRLAEDEGKTGRVVVEAERGGGEGGGEGGAAAATTTAPTIPDANAPPPPPAPQPSRPFVHYGIGCDACGAFPIVGRRFQCADCPEAIGFDACGECVAASAAGGAGRFAQAHTPAHALREVVPVRTGLHVLQDLNPDLSVDAILRLRALALDREGDEEEGGDGGGEVGGNEAAAQPPPAVASSVLIEEAGEAEGGGADAAADLTLELDRAALPPGFPFAGVDDVLAFFRRLEERAASGGSPDPEDEEVLRRFFPRLWEGGGEVAAEGRGSDEEEEEEEEGGGGVEG